MITRTLTFAAAPGDSTNPSEEQKKFALLVNLFLSGGNTLHFDPQRGQTARTKDDRRNEAKFVRAYKAIAVEQKDDKGIPNGAWLLNAEGGTIAMEQDTYKLLEKYMEAAPSLTQDSDRIDDLLDWVSAADKAEN